MSTDNRTMLNDCEANTGWTGDDASTVVNATGEFYEGSNALSSQFGENVEEMYTTQDSVGMGTFSIDLSDSTVYWLAKDNLLEPFAQGGMGLIMGDDAGGGGERVGYYAGGNDAVGIPLSTFYNGYKFDVSVIVATPGSDFTVQTGTESLLNHAAITQIGIQTHHLDKANGPSDNCFYDAFRYIANDSYALTINGGTSGTPETMSDVAGDDITNGWGLVSNPVGDLYYFNGPTEWGEDTATADHYFEANNEQWIWLGDNGGGAALGAGHFPMRLISNATDTGSFVLNGVAVTNTGTGADFDMSDTNFDTVELDLCTFIGLNTAQAPSSGGTSRFCTNTAFVTCGLITHNGADMSGGSILESTVAANEGAILFDENSDPDTVMEGMTFVKGANAHHAIRFGANIPSSITLRNCTFEGFSGTDDANDSIFHFDDTSGTITLNLVGCTNDGGGFSVDSRDGATVVVNIDPVTVEVTVRDYLGALRQDARVYVAAKDGDSDLPFEDVVTITRSGTVATVSHTAHGLNTGEYVKLQGITGNKSADNNGAQQITFVDANSYTFVTDNSGDTTYSGSISASGVLFFGLTNASGVISASRTLSADQNVIGRVRYSTVSPRHKTFDIDDTISNTTGLSVTANLIIDQNPDA